MNDEKIDFVEPKYLEHINRNRFYICIAFGIIFRFLVLFNITTRVVPYFAVIFLAYRISVHFSIKGYPKHGYIVNVLLIAGLNERLVVNIGRLLDLSWEFFVDLILLMFSYLCTHIVTELLL